MTKTISVKIIPRSSQNNITELPDGSYKIKLTAAPVDGEANKKLIELISNHFSVSKSSVSIVKGKTAKTKIINIEMT